MTPLVTQPSLVEVDSEHSLLSATPASPQHLLLPRRLPRLETFELAGSCCSSQAVGGDFYDVLSVSPGKTWMLIADVMGKGVAAALMAATVRGLARMLARLSSSPGMLLRELNNVLYDELAPNRAFVTMQALLLEGDRLVLANAGHCPALAILNRSQSAALAPEGIPLGILPEANFCEEAADLTQINDLLLHTDGITDAVSPAGERFGLNRLKKWLLGSSLLTCSAAEMKDRLIQELTEFQAGGPPADDQTFVLLRRKGLATEP